MIKRLLWVLAMFGAGVLGGVASAQANLAGTLYAINFAGWTVPQGNNGPFSWSSASVCRVSSAEATFPAFTVGTPVEIVDTGTPGNSEIVVPTAVSIGPAGCSITVAPVNAHYSFYLRTATAGLQESINYARTVIGGASPQATVLLTPAWSQGGGTTAMVTAATGTAAVSILDERTSVVVPYVWQTAAYVAQPFASGSGVGTVTSVGVALPTSLFGCTGSPVTTAGTITCALLAQAANTVLTGPASGAPGLPGFRALVSADIPPLNYLPLSFSTGQTVSAGSGASLTFNMGANAQFTANLGDNAGFYSGHNCSSPGFISGFSGDAFDQFTFQACNNFSGPIFRDSYANTGSPLMRWQDATGATKASVDGNYGSTPFGFHMPSLSITGCAAGTYAKADGTGCGTPSSTSTIPTYALVAGDSLEAGFNLTTPQSAWPNGFQLQEGIPTLNMGVSGATTNSLDQAGTLFNGPHPCTSAGTVLYQIGSNNMITYGADSYQISNFQTDLEAQMAWYAACPNIVPATSFAYTGTWTAGPFVNSKTASTSGNTATFTATGPIVILSTVMPAGVNAGTATWKIDGITQSTPLLFTGYGNEAISAGAQQALAVVTGLSNTTHTVVVTVTSSSGSVGLVWGAGISGTANSAWPTLFQGIFPPTNPATSTAGAYGTAITTDQTTLASYGLNVVLVNNSAIAPSTNCYIDNVHLNDYCNNLMGNKFALAYATNFGLPLPTSATNPYIGGVLQNEAYLSGVLTTIVNGQTAATNGATNTAGTEDLIVGGRAGRNVTSTANYDTFLGPYAGQGVTSGSGDTFLGTEAGTRIYMGSYDVAIDYSSMGNSADVNNTVAIGFQSLNNVQLPTSTSTAGNTAIGHQSGFPGTPASGITNAYAVQSSTRMTLLGAETGQATASTNNYTNCAVVGDSAQCAANNSVQLGAVDVKYGFVGPYLFFDPDTLTSVTAGTGVTSAVCATGNTCTAQRGRLTIVGGTATTGTIATLVWPTTENVNVTTPQQCSAYQAGGTTWLGISNNPATATGMNITSGVSVAGLTVTVDYICKP